MKKLVKVGLVVGSLILSGNVFATVGQFEDRPAMCYILKNNKLNTKSTCTYSGSSGGGIDYVIFEADFNVNDSSKFNIVNNKGNQGTIITVNNIKAINQSRDANNLKVLTKSEFRQREKNWENKGNSQNWENMGYPSYLDCYKQKQSGLELCYARGN